MLVLIGLSSVLVLVFLPLGGSTSCFLLYQYLGFINYPVANCLLFLLEVSLQYTGANPFLSTLPFDKTATFTNFLF